MKAIKFYHSKAVNIRFLPAITDSNGEVLNIIDSMSETSLKVPRVTVASVYDPDKNTLRFGTATCSPKDVYLRKEGNRLALSRALSTPELTIILKSRRNVSKDSKKYVEQLMRKHLPTYVSSSI